MSLRALYNPAGGVRYHLRALRFARRHWQPFRWSIGEWLLGWQPPCKTLILVGPSAGYCLQPFLFEKFEHLICLEPDPIARLLFKRKLNAAPLEQRPTLEFIVDDCLVRHPERLPKLVATQPDACLLFSNVIGQLRGLLEVQDTRAPELCRVRTAINESIAGRCWASFHDRVSGYVHPTFEDPVQANSRLSDEELIELLYATTRVSKRSRDTQLIDHLTEGFFPKELPHAYFTWEIEPGRFHVIEAVSNQ